MIRLASLLLAATTVAGPALSAQAVHGRLTTSSSDEPLAGALVVLLDGNGAEVARSATTPSGGFALRAPAAGRYHVVVRQIGQQPWRSQPFVLADGVDHALDVRIEPEPYVLPPVTVSARRARCDVTLDDDDLLGRLLDAASTALGIAQESAETGSYGFSTETYLKRLSTELALVESTSTHLPRLTRWPIESADPDSLRVWGFAHTPAHQALTGPTYYGPDARVLFSEWFLGSHCFEAEADGDRVVEVRFEPERRGQRVGLEGRLVIDRASLELKLMAFEYVNLPRWVPDNQAGGQLELRRLGAGAWVPVAWYLRAPVPMRSRRTSRVRLGGWMETGGRVTGVHTARGVPDSALTAELMGEPP